MKNTLRALLLNTICLGVVFALHYFFPSLLNGEAPFGLEGARLDAGFMERVWRLHIFHPAFQGRLFTSGLLSVLHGNGIDLATGFVIINFGCLFLAGYLVYLLATGSEKNKLLSLILFYTGFTILFAFFRSIDSYDDPLQYVLLLGALLAAKKKWFAAMLALLCGAQLVRETTMLLLPAWLVFAWLGSLLNARRATLLVVCFIVTIVGGTYLGQMPRNAPGQIPFTLQDRFTHWRFNFQNKDFAAETIVSILLTLGPALLLTLRYAARHPWDQEDLRAILPALVGAAVVVPIVLISGRAREARLFALPLIFLWPVLGKYAQSYMAELKNAAQKVSWRLLLPALIALALAYAVSFHLYHPTYAAGFGQGFQFYAFIVLALGAVGELLRHQNIAYAHRD